MTDLRQVREGISNAWMIGAAWLCVMVLAVVAYWPGLSGPFVLDDFTTIAQLGNLGGVTNWETFNAFVFGGTAGPTGRPVALLSFLIDGLLWLQPDGPSIVATREATVTVALGLALLVVGGAIV